MAFLPMAILPMAFLPMAFLPTSAQTAETWVPLCDLYNAESMSHFAQLRYPQVGESPE